MSSSPNTPRHLVGPYSYDAFIRHVNHFDHNVPYIYAQTNYTNGYEFSARFLWQRIQKIYHTYSQLVSSTSLYGKREPLIILNDTQLFDRVFLYCLQETGQAYLISRVTPIYFYVGVFRVEFIRTIQQVDGRLIVGATILQRRDVALNLWQSIRAFVHSDDLAAEHMLGFLQLA